MMLSWVMSFSVSEIKCKSITVLLVPIIFLFIYFPFSIIIIFFLLVFLPFPPLPPLLYLLFLHCSIFIFIVLIYSVSKCTLWNGTHERANMTYGFTE